jgi:DNA-binding response OmpR family regulator
VLILLVDHDKNLADTICCEFKQAQLQHVSDGEEGIKVALKKQFDLIVMNSELPGIPFPTLATSFTVDPKAVAACLIF